MQKRVKHTQRRTNDPNGIAHKLVDVSTRESDNEQPLVRVPKTVSQYMAAIGRKGGQVGGKQRLNTMSPEERQQVAQRAARARWDKRDELEGKS